MAEELTQEQLESVMGLIMNGGNAKGASVEAIRAAKKGDFAEADEKLKQADKFMVEAHNSQTEMLTKEAQGDPVPVTLLMVHGQDHMMTALTFRDLAGEIVDVYKTIAKDSKADA